MAKRKPVDQTLLERSQSAVLGYAASRRPQPGPEPAELADSPLARALVPSTGYVAPSLGAPAPAPTEGQSARWEGYNAWDYLKDLVANETLSVSAAIILRENGYRYDPTYRLPALDSPEWKALTEGIDPEKWYVLGNALSESHAHAIAFRLREEKEREARLMESGILPFLVGNILNPESVLTAMGTGGLSWIQKGNRLRRAMKLAGVSAAENAALEAGLFALQDNRDVYDVAFAGAAGLLLGGTFGALSKGIPDGPSKEAFMRAAQRDMDRIAEAQAEELGLIKPSRAETLKDDLARTEEYLSEQARRLLDLEEARLQQIIDGPDGQLVRMRGGIGDTEVRLAKTRQEIERLRREADVDRTKAIEAEIKKITKARRTAGQTEVDLVRDQYVIRREARQRIADRFKRTEENLKIATSLEKSLDDYVQRFRRVRNAEIELDMLRTARRQAKTLDQQLDLVDPEVAPIMKGKLFSARALAKQAQEDADRAAARGTVEQAQPQPTGFGDDSAGAAAIPRAGVETSRFSDDFDETAGTTRPEDLPWFFRWVPRFDYSFRLRGIKNDAVRSKVEVYTGDPAPKAGAVSRYGATEEADRLRTRYHTKFYQVYDRAFKEWLEERNGGFMARYRRTHRRLFGADVTKEIKGIDTGSAAAKRAAARLREIFREIGEEARAAGVKGFEDFKADATYFPRVPDRVKALDSFETYGEEAISDAAEKAMRKRFNEILEEIEQEIANATDEAKVLAKQRYDSLKGFIDDPNAISRMARGYVKKIHDLSLGIQHDALTGLRMADTDQIAGLLRLDGVDDSTIADVVSRLRNAIVNPKDGGTPRYAKARTPLDEDEPYEFFNKETGRTEQKTLRDLLFHDDAEQVFQTYSHSMSGWAALAKQAGIRSRADHDRLIDDVRRELPKKEADKVVEAMDHAYKFIVGQPIFDTKHWRTARRWGRALRDYQFARVMNMVGFAQVPDAAAWLSPQYFRYVSRHFPELASIFRRMQDGTLDHKVARELEEWVGGGTDMLHNRLYSAYDDEPLTKLSRLEHGLRIAGQITERNPMGVGPATVINQRLMELAIAQRFFDNILSKSADLSADRWLKLGLDDKMLARIRAQAEKYVEYDGNKLRDMDLAKWDDTLAREKLVQAIHRESKRLVQEEDFGDTHPIMHSALGKLILQFRRFETVSYAKQLYRGMADRDIETLTRLAIQIPLGSLSYAVQMYLYSLTKPEEERQEWREKYLTPSRLFFAGIARAGMFSFTPALYESLWQLATGTGSPFSNARTTGLAQGALAGIPAVDFASRLLKFGGDVAQSIGREDRQFDQRDFQNFRSILPFQNMIVIKQFFDFIQPLFPEDDEDDDSSTARFLGGLEVDQ